VETIKNIKNCTYLLNCWILLSFKRFYLQKKILWKYLKKTHLKDDNSQNKCHVNPYIKMFSVKFDFRKYRHRLVLCTMLTVLIDGLQIDV